MDYSFTVTKLIRRIGEIASSVRHRRED